MGALQQQRASEHSVECILEVVDLEWAARFLMAAREHFSNPGPVFRDRRCIGGPNDRVSFVDREAVNPFRRRLDCFAWASCDEADEQDHVGIRSEEHTSELQSLMRISYAVFCLKKKK